MDSAVVGADPDEHGFACLGVGRDSSPRGRRKTDL
jgi:hypothetical protein